MRVWALGVLSVGLWVESGCALFGGGSTANEIDLANPYREAGIPVRALCAADEVDRECKPRTRREWKEARHLGFQPMQLTPAQSAAIAIVLPGRLGAAALAEAPPSFDQLIDGFLYKAVDGASVPRACVQGATGGTGVSVAATLRKDFQVFSPEQAEVNRLLAEDITRQTSGSVKAEFEAKPGLLDSFATIETELSSKLEDAVLHQLSESAVLRYVRISAGRDAADLHSDARLKACLGRPLTMEVTGVIVSNKSSHREVLMKTDLDQAVNVTLDAQVLSVQTKAELKAAIHRAFQKVVRDRVNLVVTDSEPVFYPYWVRVDTAVDPNAPVAAQPTGPTGPTGPKASAAEACVAGSVHVVGGAIDPMQAQTICEAALDDSGRPVRSVGGMSMKLEAARPDRHIYWQLDPTAGSTYAGFVACECTR